MLDLNATMFYKVKFNIEALDPDKDLLWEIVMHVKEWQNANAFLPMVVTLSGITTLVKESQE